MSKDEAIQALMSGKKVRHRYFSDDESVSIVDGKYKFEDGVAMSEFEFWQLRPDECWLTDWETVN